MVVSIRTAKGLPPASVEWPEGIRLPVAGDLIKIDRVTPDEVEVKFVQFTVTEGFVSVWIDCGSDYGD